MIIKRVQVDDGFLDGLDLRLESGLNVIIGGRGTGKTSVIELIRFCLGIQAQTAEAEHHALEHALAVLGDGRITVTLSNRGEKIVVTRTASEDAPDATEDYEPPALYSQKEIESLGLSAQARIALIDSFLRTRDPIAGVRDRLVKQIGSFTAEISQVAKELEVLDSQLQQIPKLEKELSLLAASETVVTRHSKDVERKQSELKSLANKSSQLSLQISTSQRATKSIDTWTTALEDLVLSVPEIEIWPDGAGSVDKLANLRRGLGTASDSLRDVRMSLAESVAQLQRDNALAQKAKFDLDEKSRLLRKEIEALEKGAGETMKRSNLLREKLASLRATSKLREGRAVRLLSAQQARGKLLDQLEATARQKFQDRLKISMALNKSLGPQIKIAIQQSAEYSEYVSAIASALRGSGLKYNELSPIIASVMSPRELVEAAERFDIDFICSELLISQDRAARLVTSLRESRLESILTVSVEDDANFQLLDGRDYKDIAQLSVGQRCTVVLPIVLEHTERILIVDQPEDHLDNAFIVDTFIKAIKDKKQPQTLFSTHNANIPVLGNAQKVFVMQSDGQTGRVSVSGRLEDQQIVEAITTVMEGGKEAFDTRARFYHEHQ